MLTAKENMRECVRGGNPDRYVNQYEAIRFLPHPYSMAQAKSIKGAEDVVNPWGITYRFPENVPARFPVHSPEKTVVKDIENWRDYVHAPSLEFSDELWEKAKHIYDKVDGNLTYKAAFVPAGLFEQVHNLCSISEALMYYITNPDEIHDLIKYLTEWELQLAEGICSHLHPDAVFHHDDWGTERNSFLRPDMFADYFLEPYKEIYKYYHEHGCELVIHHSDCYAANLVPYMIEMGVDIWQGCMESNDVPELIRKYGGQISFMGDIDNKDVDFVGWAKEDCKKAAVRAIENCGNKHFIPSISQGVPGSVFPGAYMGISDAIDKYNFEKFGFTPEEQAAMRLPFQVM